MNEVQDDLLRREEEAMQKAGGMALKFVISGNKLTTGLIYEHLVSPAARKVWDKGKQATGLGDLSNKGRQSKKQLNRQGKQTESLNISGAEKRTNQDGKEIFVPIKKNIISFERIAKKYGIDYAIEKSKIKDPTTGLYNYQVYFKSKDRHSMSNAFREYVAEQKAAAMDKKPCIRETLSNFKEIIKNLPRPEKNRTQGEQEL